MGIGQKHISTKVDPDAERHIDDIILDRPRIFDLGGSRFAVRYPSLGKTILANRVAGCELASLKSPEEISDKLDDESLCRIIAIMSTDERSDKGAGLFDEDHINRLTEYFRKHLDREEMVALLSVVIRMCDLNDIIKYFGIDRDQESRKRIAKVKNDKDSGAAVTFGGKTVIGSVINRVAESCHWDRDYIVWGISYAYLSLTILDSCSSVYLTKDEIRKAHINTDGVVLKADEKENWSAIHELLKG